VGHLLEKHFALLSLAQNKKMMWLVGNKMGSEHMAVIFSIHTSHTKKISKVRRKPGEHYLLDRVVI